MTDLAIWQTPAFWSAVAAGCSALAAVITLLISRRSMIEAVRPHVVLRGWQRVRTVNADGRMNDFILVKRIENIGRGPAYRITVNSVAINETQRPLAGMTTMTFPVLGAGEKLDIDAQMVVFLDNAPDNQVSTSLELLYGDSRKTLYRKRDEIVIYDPDKTAVFGAFELAPGVNQIGWEVQSAAVRLLMIRFHLGRAVAWPLRGRWKEAVLSWTRP